MTRLSRRSGFVLTLTALVVAALAPASAYGASPSAAASPAPAPAAKNIKVIVTFDARPGKAATKAIERVGGEVKHQLKLIDALSAEIPRAKLKALRADPAVKAVELDGKLVMSDHTPDTGDYEYENAWGVEHIGSREVHLAGNTGQGVKVAVIDTGIDYTHDDPDDDPYVVDPEFLGNYVVGGFDFYNNDNDPMDDNGHGTHVAGIIAAEHNSYLVTGVAPGVELYALKILSAAGEGEYSGLIAALGWAVQNDMDVVNMSLGGHEVSAALQTAVTAAYDAGVTMVAASGNINPLDWMEIFYGCPVVYPAAYDEVIAVSFTGEDDRLTGYSCTGPQVDLAAPGDNILSTVPIGDCMFCTPYGYNWASGTSMASPHVAGVAALILSHGIADDGDGLLADDVKAHLCANTSPAAGMATTDPRYPKWYGCGLVDADKALIDNPPGGGGGGPTGPSAANDTKTTDEDTATDIAVLANDTGTGLTVTAVSDPPHGTATINPNGTVHYVPDAQYGGPDAFDYTVTDGAALTDSAAVAVTVTPVNDPPVAVDDTASTPENVSKLIDVVANDTDIDGGPRVVTSVTNPSHGTAVIEAGQVRYTPAAGYVGPDSFQYTVSDGAGGTDTGSVAVAVTDVPEVTSMHVGDLDGSATMKGKNWTARVTIRVENATHGALANANVTGVWSNGATGSANCRTSVVGVCTVSKSSISTAVASVTFTVTGVTLSGRTYDASANHDADPDSTGTEIVVSRP